MELPSYWQNIEELEAPDLTKQRSSQEFVTLPDQIDPEEEGMNRRGFLKVLGMGAMLATMASCRRPIEKVIPYVNKPEEITPGVANWYASTCGTCSVGCGLLVKTREGRPIKLEGNDSNPVGKGALCAKGQAGLWDLYDPDRLKGPLAKKNLGFSTLSWEALDKELKEKLNKVEGKVYFLSSPLTSSANNLLINGFLQQFKDAKHISYDPSFPSEVTEAQESSYGKRVTPRYRFDQARVILSFGADFLGGWLSPVEHARDFAKSRQVEEKKMSLSIAFESALSLSGTNADRHFAIKPGQELEVALALANELIVQKRRSRYGMNSSILRFLSPYSIENVALKVGLNSKTLRDISELLWKNKGRGLILGGGAHGQNGLALENVVNLLNTVLENDGLTIDAQLAPSNQQVSSHNDLMSFVADLNQGKIGALFILNSNPAQTFPSEFNFEKSLSKIPLVVSFAGRLDETSEKADYIAPKSHYLESWDDFEPYAGFFSIAQPAIAPLYKTRSYQDSLLSWQASQKSWYDYLQDYWKNKIYSRHVSGKSFKAFWQETLQAGLFDSDLNIWKKEGRIAGVRNFKPEGLRFISNRKAPSQGVQLQLYSKVGLGDGRQANNPWLQELPDPLSKVTWDNYLAVAPKFAKSQGLKQGDVVAVKANKISLELPIHIQPMLHSEVVMAAVGYGRKKCGSVGEGVGVNVYPFQLIYDHGIEWGGFSVSIKKTGKSAVLATTQGHQVLEGRPIVEERNFQDFLKNPHGDKKHHKPLTMWKKFDYKGHRWGMSIDLTSCTGCSACVIGCQAENNIPVVGKREVAHGREMHWIRIDRYYSGNINKPEVTHQPMLCQHCENAPCETVCPVIATAHNDEGLNVQIYNRCVGTRYCANNCPYKVRRFNFLEYSKVYNKKPLNLLLNPDVTVRDRGVMEKCTFCVQRIQDTKNRVAAKGGKLKDGELKTACQQTCPSQAIVFGDMNDKNSNVTHMKKSDRGFHVLEEVNTQPSITYLAKIRNKEIRG